MQIVNEIKSVTYLKSKAVDVLKYINETHRPMIITQNGEAKAVIQDPQSYEEKISEVKIFTRKKMFLALLRNSLINE